MADDRDMLLITLVQQHQHIYDKNSIYFKDKTAVDTSWAMIASAMKTSVNDCQRRWCVLRNRYAKERREQCKPDGQKKHWILLTLMAFLEAHVKRRRSYRAITKMQDLMLERPSVNERPSVDERLLLSKPEKWEEIIIDEDDEYEDEEPDIKNFQHSDQSNTSSCVPEEDVSVSIYKQTSKPPEMLPAPKIVNTIENYKEIEVIPVISLKEDKIPTSIVSEPSNDVQNINTNTVAAEDANMHFCLSLNESLRKIPSKYLTKAKIEILQVLDKYENAN